MLFKSAFTVAQSQPVCNLFLNFGKINTKIQNTYTYLSTKLKKSINNVYNEHILTMYSSKIIFIWIMI